MRISYTTLFVEGDVEPAINVEVNSMKELRMFSELYSPGFEGFMYTKGRVRGIALEAVDKEPGILKEFASTYNHYVLELKGLAIEESINNQQVRSLENPMRTRYADEELHLDVNDNPSYDFREMVKNLVKDCCSRMPFEFDKTGRDLGWFFLGERVLLLRGGESKGIMGKIENSKGFISYTVQDDRTVKVWMAYTKEQYRGEKVFSTLLQHLQNLCVNLGCTKLLIATDTTVHNSMNDILHNKGFILESRTYRSGVDMKRLERAKLYGWE